MLLLFVRTGCPYSAKVVYEMEALGIPYEARNIKEPGVGAELMARGGKRQTPYMVDEEGGVSLYDSHAIIKHLHERFTPHP